MKKIRMGLLLAVILCIGLLTITAGANETQTPQEGLYWDEAFEKPVTSAENGRYIIRYTPTDAGTVELYFCGPTVTMWNSENRTAPVSDDNKMLQKLTFRVNHVEETGFEYPVGENQMRYVNLIFVPNDLANGLYRDGSRYPNVAKIDYTEGRYTHVWFYCDKITGEIKSSNELFDLFVVNLDNKTLIRGILTNESRGTQNVAVTAGETALFSVTFNPCKEMGFYYGEEHLCRWYGNFSYESGSTLELEYVADGDLTAWENKSDVGVAITKKDSKTLTITVDLAEITSEVVTCRLWFDSSMSGGEATLLLIPDYIMDLSGNTTPGFYTSEGEALDGSGTSFETSYEPTGLAEDYYFVLPEDQKIESWSNRMNGFRCRQLTDNLIVCSIFLMEPGIMEGDLVVNDTTYHLALYSEGSVKTHPLVDEELLENSAYEDYLLQYDDNGEGIYDAFGPTAFTWDGKTYYLGVSFAYDGKPMTYGGEPLEEDGTIRNRSVSVDIFTFDKVAGYAQVEDPTAVFPQAFLDSLELEIFAHTKVGYYPQMAPMKYRYNLPKYMVGYADNTSNGWYYVATGKLDTQDVVAVGYFDMYVRPVDQVKLEAEEGAALTVEDINAVLEERSQKVAEDSSVNWSIFKVILPDGTISNPNGKDIVIPSNLREVRIEGTSTKFKPLSPIPAIYESGDYAGLYMTTTIPNCGVQANSESARLTNINFIGEGAEGYEASMGKPDTSITNLGVYGDAQTTYYNCSFSGFYVALQCTGDGLTFGGQNVILKDNHIGYYMNFNADNGGMLSMESFWFENNNIAVFLANFSENNDLEPYSYSISYSTFKNNRVTLHNTAAHSQTQVKRWFFAPYNLFIDNGNSNSRAVGVDAAISGNVSVYPMATDETFKDFDYGDSGVISNELDYAVPVDDLSSQEFALVSGDEPILAYTFNEEQDAPTLMMLSAPSLDGPSSEPEILTFDPTVQLTAETDKITLVMDTMPEGKTAKVFVPCQWETVKVLENGVEIEAEADQTTVSFTASEGGTYVITNEEEEEVPSVPVRPSRPAGSTSSDKQEKPNKAEFSDVKQTDWYADAVQFVYENGLMNGMGGGEFQPNAATSRAMVITMLARLSEADVEDSDPWYAKALAWAVKNGITDGTNPNGAITRQQIVTMLWRFAGEPEPQGKLEGFADIHLIADYAVKAMTWAVEQKIIQGVGENRLDATGTATRAQIATMFMNYLTR